MSSAWYKLRSGVSDRADKDECFTAASAGGKESRKKNVSAQQGDPPLLTFSRLSSQERNLFILLTFNSLSFQHCMHMETEF